jgi:hypothetical protein
MADTTRESRTPAATISSSTIRRRADAHVSKGLAAIAGKANPSSTAANSQAKAAAGQRIRAFQSMSASQKLLDKIELFCQFHAIGQIVKIDPVASVKSSFLN